jgi:hypothetical protein
MLQVGLKKNRLKEALRFCLYDDLSPYLKNWILILNAMLSLIEQEQKKELQFQGEESAVHKVFLSLPPVSHHLSFNNSTNTFSFSDIFFENLKENLKEKRIMFEEEFPLEASTIFSEERLLFVFMVPSRLIAYQDGSLILEHEKIELSHIHGVYVVLETGKKFFASQYVLDA